MELLDTFLSYQESLKKCICLVYDPIAAQLGGLPLKAVKVGRDARLSSGGCSPLTSTASSADRAPRSRPRSWPCTGVGSRAGRS